jgi:hypothetical protein
MIETMDADFSVIAMSFLQIIMHYLHPLSEADVVTGEYGSTIEVMV